MFTLKNDSLEVTLLDPVADRERFHTRYCVGGYIFQVTDLKRGPLMTGPTYPDSFNTFDGQGIPDAFNLNPLRDPDSTSKESLIIGVGLCDMVADRVVEFSPWDVERDEVGIQMSTTQSYQSYALELARTVVLRRRTVHTAIHLRNSGRRSIPIRWFPHPFFPHPQTNELCKFNTPVTFPTNDGYVMGENGFIYRKGWPWSKGHYLALDHDMQDNLVVLQRHPLLGMISATFSFVPGLLPIWGNTKTFSWEPFFEQTVARGQEVHWWTDYDF